MFSFLLRKAGYWFAKRQQSPQQSEPEEQHEKIPLAIKDVVNTIKQSTSESKDIVVREFYIDGDVEVDAATIYVDGLVDTDIINDDIIKPLLYKVRYDAIPKKKDGILEYLQKCLLSVDEIKLVDSLYDAIDGMLMGDTALFIGGTGKAFVINTKGWQNRSISEPSSESVIRGPRESFVENMRFNTAMIRRKIKNPALTFEQMVIGRRTRTPISIVYIDGLAKKELLDEVKKRLKAIRTDSILESGYIEQYIEDAPGSIFATVGFTEKPDVAAAKILEGRVAIVVDGTPFVLTVPYLFVEGFQSAEDYYFRPFYTTFIRIIRVIGFSITVLAPAFYVSVTTFHQELIPTSLLITMARSREGVPFPAFLESLLMIVVFEIIREAGVRLPRPVGQALSIVGALVIGESAVSAGLIGAPMVIVVAITAISGFLVPTQNNSAVVLRLILLVLSAMFGGFGLTLGLLGALVHLSALESFGYSYLSPTVPFNLNDSKDAMIRAPLWIMLTRPKGMADDQQRKDYMVPPVGSDKNKKEGT